MTTPLTPEEEAALRERLASGHALGLFQMSSGIRDWVARLLATLDAERAATPAAPEALPSRRLRDAANRVLSDYESACIKAADQHGIDALAALRAALGDSPFRFGAMVDPGENGSDKAADWLAAAYDAEDRRA